MEEHKCCLASADTDFNFRCHQRRYFAKHNCFHPDLPNIDDEFYDGQHVLIVNHKQYDGRVGFIRSKKGDKWQIQLVKKPPYSGNEYVRVSCNQFALYDNLDNAAQYKFRLALENFD